MREKWFTVTAVGAVCMGLLMYQLVYTVRVDQVAVHRRFNRVVRVVRPRLGVAGQTGQPGAHAHEGRDIRIVEESGWFFRLPWPVDNVEHYDQRIRVIDGPLAQTQLPDGNQVIPRVYATWRITDPVAFEETLKGDEQSAEQSLMEIISGQTGEVFGTYNLDDVVNTDAEKLKFDEIEEEILAGVRQRLVGSADAYGVEVCSLGITWLALPEDATSAVFGRMGTERRSKADTLRAEGERIKQTLIAEAEAQKSKILAEAEALAKDTRADAEAEAAQHYETFAKDEEFAIFLRRLEAMLNIAETAADSGQPLTIIASTKTPPFDVLGRGPLVRESAEGDEREEPELPLLLGTEAEAPVSAPRED